MNKTMLHEMRLSTRGKDGLKTYDSLDALALMQERSRTFDKLQAKFNRVQLRTAKKALSSGLRSVAIRFPGVALSIQGIGAQYQIEADDRTFNRHSTPDYHGNKLVNSVMVADGKSRPKVDDALHFALCPLLRMCLAFELAGLEDREWSFKLVPSVAKPETPEPAQKAAPGRSATRKRMRSPAMELEVREWAPTAAVTAQAASTPVPRRKRTSR
ncbi:hypothetical protein [Burkholderia cenocepacia]|uniref:hypothetical protein n=1 Tax=Burkholderia cenocepacia TaxID=95486 RepID=UPI000761FF4D|nr:hypothetical protein [Burkholderia cenocepacia]KWU26393.1 hypothetical protein AS149_25735 [Burkholderia cenocepacia]